MRALTPIAFLSFLALSPFNVMADAGALKTGPETSVAPKAVWPVRTLSATEAQADVALMRRSLEAIHPGLYRRTSKAHMDRAFAALDQRVKHPIETTELYRLISLVLVDIRCNHTKAEQPADLEAWRNANPSHLPFRFQIVAGKMIVVGTDPAQQGLSVGAEVTHINGRKVSELIATLGAYVPIDGQTSWSRATGLADDSDLMGSDFDHFYPYVFGLPNQFVLRFKSDGHARAQTTVQRPLSFKAWRSLTWPGPAFRANFSETTTWRMLDADTAVLKVATFVNYRKPVNASAFYDQIFAKIKESGAKHLIIDLRENGGGSSDVTYGLADFLAQKPYVWNKAISYKALRYGDLPNFIDTWGDREAIFHAPLDQFNKTAQGYEEIPANAPEELLPRSPAANAFGGRVTLLTSPENGSGSTMLIAKLRDLGRVSLVGGKSGGSGDGPTAGRIFTVKLPNSGIKLRVPNAFNHMQVQSFEPRGGVTPDLLVEAQIEDVRLGRDRVLDVARAAPEPEPKIEPAQNPPALLSDLTGKWTGTLEYRDYQTDGRVTLPTLMHGTRAPDGASINLRFTYDDGPGKTVYGGFRLAIDTQEAIASKADDDGQPDLYRVIGDLTAAGPGPKILVLWGRGTENGQAVDVRETLTVSANTYDLLRETRPKGQGVFQFRHAYHFTREEKR